MDRDLLRDIDGNPAAAGIAAAVVSMAHSLGLCVVAEGVDSEGQVPVLRGMHCDQIQGFLYAAALPSEEARRLLAHQGERPPILQPGAQIPGRMATRSDAGGQDDELLPRPAGSGSPTDPQECDDLPAPRATPLEAEDADLPRPRLVATPGTGADVVSAPAVADEGARRVLLLDDGTGSLGPLALRLGRLGVDVHYAGNPDEAQLFIAQEKASIRLLVVPPTIDLRHASSARDALAREIGAPPPLIVIGEEPDVETRALLRSAGATWILWAPFDDVELRFLMKSALALPQELFERREPRVPVDLVAKVQTGGRRDMAVLSSLSARGAFIETPDPLPIGSQLRLEIELPTDRIRVFARVVHCQADDPDRLLSPTGGMGVVFFGPDRQTELALRKTVEERATRYLL
jgi:Tfp pilus assembly protein PilZ